MSIFTKNIIPTKPPLVRGDGIFVYDTSGKKYLDGCSQTLNLSLGHNHPKIVSATKKQIDQIYYVSSRFMSPSIFELSQALVKISPINLTKINIKDVSGSLANEAAIKSARKYSGKKTILSLDSSHIGQSIEMLRASGDANLDYIGKDGYKMVKPPYCPGFLSHSEKEDLTNLALTEVEKIIQDSAGIIIEPIMVSSGVLVLPKQYIKGVRKLTKKHNSALIFDEIQTAFGWMGEVFAADYFGVSPDIMTLSKGLSGGFPLAASLFSEKYDVLDYGEHEFTYGAHPVSCAAALEVLKVMKDGKTLKHVKKMGDLSQKLLLEIKDEFDVVYDVRGVGLIRGIEFYDQNKPSKKLRDKVEENCFNNGLILRNSSSNHKNVLIFKPPIIIIEEEITSAMEILRTSIRKSL
ncbi:MAG: aspartate aminotransferase family protein [Candidatus Altiarchaeota archaeon]|nr:aspartate aminotransferase family protein [Candidatus Altiarchaeota archaeon]